MARKGGKGRGITTLAKRLKSLEIKQKADEKRTEKKNYYRDGIVSVNTTWQALNRFVLNLGQNVNEGGRIGNSVCLRRATMRFNCRLPTSTDGVPVYADQNTRVRVMIVQQDDPNLTLTITDVLKTPTYKMTSFHQDNVAEGKSYKILGDYKFHLNAASKASHQFECKFKLPKSGKVVTYPTNASTVPNNYNITVFWTCMDISPLSAGQPDLFYYLKSQYEDA